MVQKSSKSVGRLGSIGCWCLCDWLRAWSACNRAEAPHSDCRRYFLTLRPSPGRQIRLQRWRRCCDVGSHLPPDKIPKDDQSR